MPRTHAVLFPASLLLFLGTAWLAGRSCAQEWSGQAADAAPRPAYGGRVIVHLTAMPRSINFALENAVYVHRMLYEVHEFLLLQDWESWEYRPVLCHRWDEEDMLVLADGAREKYGDEVTLLPASAAAGAGPEASGGEVAVLYGTVEEDSSGWAIAPLSAGNPLGEPLLVPKEDVARVERETVFTFHLREDVPWQPSLVFREREDLSAEKRLALESQLLDARDVWFSWSIYSNPGVDCGEKRVQFQKIPRCEVVDPHTVRFFYESQYFRALDAPGTTLAILPSHVYDLSDPDNPDHDAAATPSRQARHVNENPHNRLWVGLGPYQVLVYDEQQVEARRFDRYFDPKRAGYLDVIRWKLLPSDELALQALLNGEIDFLDRITSENYLGKATEQEAFVRSYVKGHYYLGAYTYTCWNLRRPQFVDITVRQALAHAFDGPEYLQGYYKGLGRVITGPFAHDSPAYDRSIPAIPYDPERARELLEDAGWYDRNANGIRDRDGVELEFQYLLTPGNVATLALSQKLQESVAAIGMRMNIVNVEWATLQERLRNRDFDATSLAWAPPLESDPGMIWHSSGAEVGARGSNYAGVADPEVDALIERGQRELDPRARAAIWNSLHARLYSLQPYLWHYNLPTKYAIHRRLLGFRSFAIDPGYVIRDWYHALGEPGTRAALRE